MEQNNNLWSLIEQRLEASPDSTAFIEGGRAITVAQFHAQCSQALAWLQAQGVRRGDRVAVWLVNRTEWLALLFALARLGAVLVSVNTRYRSDEVSHILGKSGARLLVCQPGFRKIDFADILRGIATDALPALEGIVVVDAGDYTAGTLLGRPIARFPALDGVTSADSALAADSSDPGEAVILFTTSGTTKGPKLVMHPQRTLVDHARRCARAYGLDQPDAVMLAMLPFCGVFGLNGVLAAFAAGAPAVLMDAFDGEAAADLAQRHRVTHTFGSDEMYQRIAEAVKGEQPFPAARFFGFGAFTSSFGEYARRAWSRGIPLVGLYGSSEVLALFSGQPLELPLDARLEGGGRPVAAPLAQVRVRDTESGELLPPGRSGELEIRAPSNFLGYFNDPQATADVVLPDGFFRTGDLGHLRDDGTFVYEARMGDAIRLGGFLVNPVEIEAVLKRFDSVVDAQVVAIEIEGRMRVVAFVVPSPGNVPVEADLIAQIAGQTASFKVPARIWFVDRYPVTQSSNGVKTQRNKLRDMAIERLA
ncbi:AMP-binding protein [Cupriavidus pinatubonensis]|uniref:Long-chain-fatty-acid--CoA ligase n=1 Tax=Cupriavidus pinatubonensis TaxID=248026 RepID=A0ABN7Z7B7_9BURK|nr:AMP-binding protein [Cupriavidus pinatubonensis]CAG9179922.1 3-[(3aS,4S,7aS)-7a-methyl-1, 5-dioxo-octahydro-1H-inden-4-yl]propanoyl:CoA ligase [Cupriavidus pinatubonensis]